MYLYDFMHCTAVRWLADCITACMSKFTGFCLKWTVSGVSQCIAFIFCRKNNTCTFNMFYICLQQVFYGPTMRKMGFLGLIRLGVWQNFIRAWRSGYQGNTHGEGFILGGVFVIGSGNQVTSLGQFILWPRICAHLVTDAWLIIIIFLKGGQLHPWYRHIKFHLFILIYR